MAGLLDAFGDENTRFSLGLLAAAGPRFDGANDGQRIQEALQGMDAYKQRQTQAQMQKMQMEAYQAQVLQQKAAQEAAQRKKAALPSLYTRSPALSPLMGDASTGILPSAGRPAGPAMIDVQAALAAGYSPEEIQKLDGLRNLGLDEVARTVDTEGAGGSKTVQAFDKYMRPVGQGVSGYVAPVSVNQGDRTTFVKPSAGTSLPMNMSFSDRNAAANLAISRERLNFDRAGGAEGAKPQLVDGQWVYKPDAQNPGGRVVPVQGIANKPMTDSQSKAYLFGTRAQEAEQAIKSVADKADRPGWIKRTAQSTVGMVPFAGDKLSEVAGSTLNWTQSGAQQQVEQAQENFLNALLRRESGAVIGADEKANAKRQYFPQVGDSDAVLSQKARNRRTAIDGIMAEVPNSRNAAPSAPSGDGFADPAKESRYQEWKRRNGG